MTDTESLLTQITENDDQASETLDSILSEKIDERLESFKIEVIGNMFGKKHADN